MSGKQIENGGQKTRAAELARKVWGGVVVTWALAALLVKASGQVLHATIEKPFNALLGGALGSLGLSDAVISRLCAYGFFIGLMGILLVAFFVIKPAREYLRPLGTGPSGNKAPQAVVGALIGLCIYIVCAALSHVFAGATLGLAQISIHGALVYAILVLVQATYEQEVSFGFVYRRVARRYGEKVAVVAAAALFSLLNLLNPGIQPVELLAFFVQGLFFALLVWRMDSPWMAIAAYAGWTFAQDVLLTVGETTAVSAVMIPVFALLCAVVLAVTKNRATDLESVAR